MLPRIILFRNVLPECVLPNIPKGTLTNSSKSIGISNPSTPRRVPMEYLFDKLALHQIH
jgi:hypothetical protein